MEHIFLTEIDILQVRHLKNIKIKFPKEQEILSRGSLPPAQTMGGFYLGESVPVNEKLSEISEQSVGIRGQNTF